MKKTVNKEWIELAEQTKEWATSPEGQQAMLNAVI